MLITIGLTGIDTAGAAMASTRATGPLVYTTGLAGYDDGGALVPVRVDDIDRAMNVTTFCQPGQPGGFRLARQWDSLRVGQR